MNATWVRLLRSEGGGPGPPRCDPAGVATPAGSHRGRERVVTRARPRAAGARPAAAGGTAGAGAPGEGPGNGLRPGRVPAGRPLTPEEPHPCHIHVVIATL